MSHYDPNKHGPHHGHNQPQSGGDLSPELRKLYNHLVEHFDRGFHALQKDIHMASAELTRLQASVAQNRTVIESAITLLNGLAQQIRDNAQDPAALNALADDMDAEDANLANAIASNTPVVPNPNTPGSNPRNLPDGSPNPNFDPNLPETA